MSLKDRAAPKPSSDSVTIQVEISLQIYNYFVCKKKRNKEISGSNKKEFHNL